MVDNILFSLLEIGIVKAYTCNFKFSVLNSVSNYSCPSGKPCSQQCSNLPALYAIISGLKSFNASGMCLKQRDKRFLLWTVQFDDHSDNI